MSSIQKIQESNKTTTMRYSTILLMSILALIFQASCSEDEWSRNELQEVDVLSLTNIEGIAGLNGIDFYVNQNMILFDEQGSMVLSKDEDIVSKEDKSTDASYILDFTVREHEVDAANNPYFVTRNYHCEADKQTMKGTMVCVTQVGTLTNPAQVEATMDIALTKKLYTEMDADKEVDTDEAYSSDDLSTFAATVQNMSPLTRGLDGTVHLGFKDGNVPDALLVQFGQDGVEEDQRMYLYSATTKGYFIEAGAEVPAGKQPLWVRSINLADGKGDVLAGAWPTSVGTAADGRAQITLPHANARVSISVRYDTYYEYPLYDAMLTQVLTPQAITDYVWNGAEKAWSFAGTQRSDKAMVAVDAKSGNVSYGIAAKTFESFMPAQTIASAQSLFSCTINDEVLTYAPAEDLTIEAGTHYNFFFVYSKDKDGNNILRLEASDSQPWAAAPVRSTPYTNPEEWVKDEEASMEFNSEVPGDHPVWEKVTSGWSSWAFDADNVFVEDDHLVLRLKYAGDGNKVVYNHKGGDKEYNYISGMLNTRPGKRYTYGYFEARIQGTPKFPGTCPAFWLWSDDEVRQANKGKEGLSCYNEIDVVEMQQVKTDVMTMECNLHAMMTEGGVEYYKRPRTDNGKWAWMCQNHFDVDFDPRDDYHIYAVENRPDSIFWYIDDKLVAKKRNYYWHLPMQVTLSLGLRPPYEYYDENGVRHPDWEKGTDEGFPSDMKVDYIRIWERKE